MERWEGKVAMVTGASVGIGAAIAKMLVEKGMKVVGLSRRTDLIEEMIMNLKDVKGELFAVKCDLSNENDILESFKWVKDNLGPVHVLVNNAGLTKPTSLLDSTNEDLRAVFDVNVLALIIFTREVANLMRENAIAGHIINIGSISGAYPVCLPTPALNVYPASKYAVTSVTETFRQEFRFHESGIKITLINPGVVKTDFHDNFVDNGTRELMKGVPSLLSEDIAEAVLYTLGTPPHCQVHEMLIHALGELF